MKDIQVGDLVRIRTPRPGPGPLAIVLAIHPSHRTVAHHMREVDVLIGEKHYNFMMYELEGA